MIHLKAMCKGGESASAERSLKMPLQDPGELPGAGEGETCGSQAGLGAPAEPAAAGHRHWRWAVRLSAPTLGPGTRRSSLKPIIRSRYPSKLFAYGHTTLITPDLVRSRKLSRVGPGQYLDGRPPGNTRCCKLFLNAATCMVTRYDLYPKIAC